MTTVPVSVRLTEEQYKLLEEDAKKNERSVSGQIRWILFGDKEDEVE